MKRRFFIPITVLLLLFFAASRFVDLPVEQPGEGNIHATLETAIANQLSDVVVSGSGVVIRTLSDDTRGSRHQRFIIRVDDGRTLLMVHNIDLAPRIDSLQKGDKIDFKGKYIWNKKGGLVHWTHHDPAGKHPPGWIRHHNRLYH